MAQPILNIIASPTYNVNTMCILDASIYPVSPYVPESPTIQITPPGFNLVVLPFSINNFNIFTTVNLGISDSVYSLPDGIYYIKYSVNPAYENFVEVTYMRVEKLLERYDEAFLTLEFMECDALIKKQSKDLLNSIYVFIQGSIAAANNCATDQAIKLYNQAENMLNGFFKNNCNC